MSPASRRTSRFTVFAEAALAVLVVMGPLSLGGAARWGLVPLGVVAGLALGLASVGARRQGQSFLVPWLAAPLVGAIALCLAQLVPLPTAVLEVFSPEAASLREFALVPLGLTGLRPVSMDPPATWRELAKHLAYLMAFLAAVQVCRSRASRQRLLSVVAFTGAGVAAVGFGHALFGVNALFGVLPWVHAQPTLVTFFANPNHLAGFLGLAATVSLGLALTVGERVRALLFALAALVSGAGVLLSLSRGGIVFFVFGQVLLALLLIRQRRGGEGRPMPMWGRSAAVLFGLLAVLASGAYLAADRLWAEARTADSVDKLRHSKVELWPMMVRAAESFPVLGMGRGAFEPTFPRYQTEPNPNTLTHPENVVLQWGAEFGVPGLMLLVLGAWAFLRLLRQEGHGAAELAALGGVAALGLHNLFDFSLELPACAVAAWVVLGTVARPSEDKARAGSALRSVRPRPAMAWAVGLGALSLGAAWLGRHDLESAESELVGLVAAKAPLEQVRERGLALIDLHPSDYLLYQAVGVAYANQGSAQAGSALAFVNRALYLRPVDAPSHRVAARALLVLGRRAQGFLEYRLAHEAGDVNVLLAEALPRARTVDELSAMTPDTTEDAVRLADALLNTPGRQDAARDYLAWAREHFEGRVGMAALWAREARLRLARGESEAASAACAEVEQREPEALSTLLLRADVLRAQGKGDEALQSLERLLARFPGNVELSFTLAARELDAGLTRRARDTLDGVGPFLTDFQQRARLLALEAACFEHEGLLSRAVERRQSVARLQPSPDAYFAVARLQEALQRYDAAARSVHDGLRLMPPGTRKDAEAWAARLEAVERGRVEARRKELVEDPRAQELEHYLRTPDAVGDGAMP
ncbi:O-antigen ligase family protein [Myxococcaceae bacterium JPH2]|nr:O-antigen ligase family protein [Myxococcaceae bacterium JPH2]